MGTKRLGAAVSSTLLLLGRRLLGFAILEVILAAIMAVWNIVFSGSGPLPGVICEAVVAVFMLLAGVKIYDDHTSFCILNSVSKAQRAVSAVIAFLVMSLAASSVCTAVRVAVYGTGFSTSLAKFIRIAIHTGLFPAPAFAADLLELAVFFLAVICCGYFLGAVRQRLGNGKLLLILFILAFLLCGNIALSARTGFNALTYVCLPIAYMQKTRGLSMLLSLLLATLLGVFGFMIRNERIDEK